MKKNNSTATTSASLAAILLSGKLGSGIAPVASAPDTMLEPTGAGSRMLIYSHDTFGLGHLQRCLKISAVLAARFPALSILLVTGSPVVHRFKLPAGVDYVKLPAVRKVGPEQYEARSLSTSYQRILDLRTGILLRTMQEYSPHLLLVDHSPIGMKGEMLPSLEWLRVSGSDCHTILGLRDIIDEPDQVIKHWNEQHIYNTLDNLYDHIMIYGSRSLFDPVAAYQFPPNLRNKTRFCNYVSGPQANGARSSANGNGDNRKQVLLTIGGGDGGGETVLKPYLEMLRSRNDHPDFDSLIITGPFISDALYQDLKNKARGLPVKIKRFVSSLTPLMRRSDLVIATAGYNTVTQILGAARRALLIPRVMHRKEQLMRSECLAELGVVRMIHPQEVTPTAMGREVDSMLASTVEPLCDARRNDLIKFDGAEQLADTCREILISCAANREVSDD